MLLTLEANENSSTKSLNKISNNSCNNNNNDNNCLTTMTCLCGCISCCHSKAASKTSSTTTAITEITRKIAKTLTMIPAATALVLTTTTSTKTIISSSSSSPTSTTTTIPTTTPTTIPTMKTSTAASSSSTKDISNYMHCASSKCHHAYICHNSDTNTNTNNSDSCHATCISNSFCSIINNNNNSNYKNIRNCIFNINNNFNKLIKLIIVLMFFTCCDLSQAALRDVNLYIEPPAVRRSQSVALHCHYTLEGAPLYSVKFYRGQLEFFRYTPGEYPNTKVFHYPGIKVDESVSNATQVVIRNVNFGLSGNFSCEVTADAPLFSTATAYAQMQVVEFPDKRPQLFTEHTRYEPGDVLRANCSTPPSRPRAELRFTINNMPVSSEETQYVRTVDNLIASRLSLKVQLQAIHFSAAGATTAIGSSNSHMINALNGGGTTDGSTSYASAYNGGGSSSSSASGGALVLRCTAQIGDLYQEYKEIELGTPLKDPIPARVTSSGGGFTGFLETYFGPSSTAARVNLHNLPNVLMSTIMLIIMANYYQTR